MCVFQSYLLSKYRPRNSLFFTSRICTLFSNLRQNRLGGNFLLLNIMYSDFVGEKLSPFSWVQFTSFLIVSCNLVCIVLILADL